MQVIGIDAESLQNLHNLIVSSQDSKRKEEEKRVKLAV